MIKVTDVTKYVDPKTFQPKLHVSFEASVEQITDEGAVNESQAYETLGRKLMAQIKLMPPKRVPGTAIFNMNTPCEIAEYQTLRGETYRIPIEAATMKLDSLDELGSKFNSVAGENADIFLLKLTCSKATTSDMKTIYIYMCRFAFVTEEFRTKHDLIHCVSHDSSMGLSW